MKTPVSEFVPSYWCRNWLVLLALVATICGADVAEEEVPEIIAVYSDDVQLNCPFVQEKFHSVYIVQWRKARNRYSQIQGDVPVFTWYDGFDSDTGQGFEDRVKKVEGNNTSIVISNLTNDDEGIYICKILYLGKPDDAHNETRIKLKIHNPVFFSSQESNSSIMKFVRIGWTTNLRCSAQGNPHPEISWYFNGSPVVDGDKFQTSTYKLTIKNISSEVLEKKIVCEAKNSVNLIQYTTTLTDKALFMKPSQNVTTLEWDESRFPCVSRIIRVGHLRAEWSRNGVPIQQLPWLSIRTKINQTDGTLIINNSSAADSGAYTCHATSTYSDLTYNVTSYLNVEYKATVTYIAERKILEYNQEGLIDCYYQANPADVTIRWSDSSQTSRNLHEDFNFLNNGSLYVNKVGRDHERHVRCQPSNKHGFRISSTTENRWTNLEVPDLVHFDRKPGPEYRYNTGSRFTLHCSGGPIVTWRRLDGRTIDKDRFDTSGNLYFKSLSKSDHGEYECKISNNKTSLEALTNIIVPNVSPHAPFNLTLEKEPGNSSAWMITWQDVFPGDLFYGLSYLISYRLVNSTEWINNDSYTPNYTVFGLKINSTYEIHVMGVNYFGNGTVLTETIDATV